MYEGWWQEETPDNPDKGQAFVYQWMTPPRSSHVVPRGLAEILYGTESRASHDVLRHITVYYA